ncbi:hypothetical protein CKW46_07100 [Mycobacterium liflandii]|nr:hypothetical protein CKW46_07100 [Mycobacterium liflandii]
MRRVRLQPRDAHQMAQSAIFDIVGRARAAGASGTEIRQLFDSVLNDLDHAHAVALDSRPPLDGDTWPTAW